MRKFKKIVISITLLISICNIVSGAGMSVENAMKQNKNMTAEEKNEVNKIELYMGNSIVQEVKSLGKSDAHHIESSMMYKVYDITSPNLFMDLRKDSSFRDLISLNYTWEVPVVDAENNIVSTYTLSKGKKLNDLLETGIELSESQRERVKKLEGKWDVTLVGNYMPMEGINLLCNNLELKNLLSSGGINTPQEIKVVKFALNTYVIYINDSSNEYAIVYNMRPDFINMENGKVYEMSAFIQNFQEVIRSYTQADEAQYSGGRVSELNQSLMYLLLGTTVLLIAGCLLLYIKKKKNIQSS